MCSSKLLVMTWLCGAARAFQRNPALRRVELAAMCPGAIASNIARNTPYLAGVVTFIMKIFFPSPYKAAAPVVWMALADRLSPPPGQPIYYQHLWQEVTASALFLADSPLLSSVTQSLLICCHRKRPLSTPWIPPAARASMPTWHPSSTVCSRDCGVNTYVHPSRHSLCACFCVTRRVVLSRCSVQPSHTAANQATTQRCSRCLRRCILLICVRGRCRSSRPPWQPSCIKGIPTAPRGAVACHRRLVALQLRPSDGPQEMS